MGKRTGRPRGAPKGNQNRLKHGLYSKAYGERRQAVRERAASARFAIAQAFAWTACEIAAAKQAADAKPSPPKSPVP